MSALPDHILVYEPRLVGFHPFWLRLITEDLLVGGYRVTVAVNGAAGYERRRQEALGEFSSRINTVLLPDRIRKGWHETRYLAAALDQSGADRALVVSLDEVASHCLRRAALGWMPPRRLRGRLGGVYLRPRFLENAQGWSLNQFLKRRGFGRLWRGGWFDRLFLQDEFLVEPVNRRLGAELFRFLPDPWVGDFSHETPDARQCLGVPEKARIFLFYGTASPRKGLWVVTEAFRRVPKDAPVFLLCVGDVAKDPAAAADLEGLTQEQRAKVIARYVSQAEQDLAYCAADVVLLPYLGHYGSSGVLQHAAAAGKMVIASEGELVRRRVERHQLGWLFPSGQAGELARLVEAVTRLTPAEVETFRQAGLRYARTCSREAFRAVLLEGLAGRPSGPA